MKAPRTTQRNTFKLGWLDFGLSALASCLAVYSTGMGLKVPEISWFLCGWIVLGAVVSFALNRIIPERHTWIGGGLYTLVAAGSVIYAPALNAMLPKGGFPFQLIVAGALAWMLLLGSFLTWRDSTMVFQAVPSIALFGLVGAWDTFSGAPFAFFGFLLCFATLFARAHGRVMMLQAEESGYTDTSLEPGAPPGTGAGIYESLRRGPWHWMAGPEWALGSAAVIVLLSVLGAPIFQSSVQGVAGFVKISVPQAAPQVASAIAAFRSSSGGSVSVGQGPRPDLTLQPVFTARMFSLGSGNRIWSRAMYFRTRSYDRYTGRGWAAVADFDMLADMLGAMDNPNSLINRSRNEIDPFRRLQFDIEFFSNPQEGVPLPGELDYMTSPTRFMRRPDGTLRFADPNNVSNQATGVVRIPDDDADPKDVETDVAPVYTNVSGGQYPERVKQLAVTVTAGKTSDYEKAIAIKKEIESRCGYDLQAPGVPEEEDPVEWFLFTGKRGYCDLFASAMTMMARSAGLPARYVTGYYPALAVIEKDGKWILHNSEAHAWCEIYFKGHGWVPFDATEGAPDVGQPTSDIPLMERGWFRATAFTVVGLTALLTPLMFAAMVRRRRAPKDRLRAEVGRQYGRFVRGLEKSSRKPKRPSQTPEEYFETIASILPQGVEGAREVNDKFVVAMYAPPESLNGNVGSLRSEVTRVLKKGIKRPRKP